MSKNLTQQLVHDLGMAIINGEYGINGSLPSEAVISEQFGISRSATREAVKMLTAKGLLLSRPRQGIRVLPETSWNMFDTEVLGWLLNSRPSSELLLEFAQMRFGIEPEAAALAAEYKNPEKIAEIEAACLRMADAELGLDDPLDADICFHVAILHASNNRFYKQMSAFIETALRVSIRYTNAIKGVAGADAKAHEQVLNAIKKGNSRLARKKVEDLLTEAIELIKEGNSARRSS